MPSKKRKYNARFPAGRIKKIMQTDEEVGKVAQAVPVIISRTLELFVESLLSKAMQVTVSRSAKTLSPSHVKQCILAESRFDFLKDLVKNIPDVSAAEEKEMQMSAESSPNSSRFSDTPAPRRIVREDSNSSSSCDVRIVQPLPRDVPRDLPRDLPREPPREPPRRDRSVDADIKPKIETITSTIVSNDGAIDLTVVKKEDRVIRTANFYQETLVEPQHKSVITVNPTYNCPQPSTSSYAPLTPVEPLQRTEAPKPDIKPLLRLNIQNKQNNNIALTPPRTPITPIINIDFSKNIANPEIKVLDNSVANILGKDRPKLQRHISKSHKTDTRKDPKPLPVSVDHSSSGELQIDEDYDT